VSEGRLERLFEVRARGSTLRTEFVAGTSTFLTMAYIIFVQPAVLSGSMFHTDTGLDFGAVMTATCLAAAFATALMGLWAKTPIALAPGMGQNFLFALTLVPAVAAAGIPNAAGTALGVVFLAGLLFLAVSATDLRHRLVEAISPSMRAGIAVGIGLFIAFVGLQNGGVIAKDAATGVALTRNWLSPEMAVFFTGLGVTGALLARGHSGAILAGIGSATVLALVLRLVLAEPPEVALPTPLVGLPPARTAWLAMDLRGALSLSMLPFVLLFLLTDFFDTTGTLVGVTEAAGLTEKGILPSPQRAYLTDATATVFGAALGTSTVTSYIESAVGVHQGGRTGLTSVVTAACFLLALFFSPLVALVGSYPPITASALVVVGALFLRGVSRIEWSDPTEALPAFLIAIGIPLSYSISDGLALGFAVHPVFKLLSGRARELRWENLALSGTMLLYLLALRSG
jgi:AGZA family xanthine/uracil permease-like MFS transporter